MNLEVVFSVKVLEAQSTSKASRLMLNSLLVSLQMTLGRESLVTNVAQMHLSVFLGRWFLW